MPAAALSMPSIKPLGDAAATVAFGDRIESESHQRVLGFCARLGELRPRGVKEWAPAFASVTVWFDPDLIGFDALQAVLAPLAQQTATIKTQSAPLFEIPFCPDAEFAPDLAGVAALKGLSPEDYVARFAEQTYEAAMLGFQPGFAYLSGLPEALDVPRLETPRKKVPARSVALADGMCAAYPFDSPGGWRLIGKTPAPLFDPRNPRRPALLAPGDRVRWRKIDRATFERLEREWSGGAFAASQLRTSS
jgi:KipI family sensor histidine kinase inhibitor